MKFDYEGTYPKPPEMHLRARLGWEYFFGNSPDWACTRTEDGAWILTDERCDLDHAFVHPDDDALIEWLDLVVREHLEDDMENFLENFVIVKELMNPEVAAVMKKIIMADMEQEGTTRESVSEAGEFEDIKETEDVTMPEKAEIPPDSTFFGGTTFSEEDLIRLLKANRSARIVADFINGDEFDCDCLIATVIQDVCGIPHTDAWNDWLLDLLDKDIDIEKKAKRLRNWNK